MSGIRIHLDITRYIRLKGYILNSMSRTLRNAVGAATIVQPQSNQAEDDAG